MRFLALTSFLAVVGLVCAHQEHRPTSTEELVARNREYEVQNVAARKCAAEISDHENSRIQKRSRLMKRQWTPTTTAPKPHYTAIQNSTCVLHPETIEGPYYINNEYIRTDLRETQVGVTLVIDIGLIDSRNCKPLPNAFVELWGSNSTGLYGGYPEGLPTHIKTDTFLRGGYFTDDAGIVEISTIYPGYYEGRTAHIHAMVHNNWKANANGTLQSGGGSVNHVGQFYFDEIWNDRVYATHPYNTITQPRTLNSQDWILPWSGGTSFIKLEYLNGVNLDDGLLGYITVVVNGAANYRIQNTNYLKRRSEGSH